MTNNSLWLTSETLFWSYQCIILKAWISKIILKIYFVHKKMKILWIWYFCLFTDTLKNDFLFIIKQMNTKRDITEEKEMNGRKKTRIKRWSTKKWEKRNHYEFFFFSTETKEFICIALVLGKSWVCLKKIFLG